MRLAQISLLLVLSVSAFSSAETLIIADKLADVLLYFDTDSGQVTRSIPVGPNPHEVVVTLDGRMVLSANSRSNSVSVVDLATGSELKRLTSPLLKYPHGLAIHPNGETIYLTSEQKQLLVSIDVGTLEITGSTSTDMEGSHMVVLSPEGDRAYTTNRESGTVSMFQTHDLAAIQHSPAGDGVEGIALSPDGRWLVVANRHDNDVMVFDASNLELSGRIPVGKGPVRVAFSPEGRWVLVSHRLSDEVAVLDLTEREVKA